MHFPSQFINSITSRYVIKRNRLYSSSGGGGSYSGKEDMDSPQPMSSIRIILNGLYSIYTFLVFITACWIAPLLFLSYICTQACRRMWFSWLENKYRGLEFVKQMTVRTVVDTHRNQGILTVLLQVSGPCQINYVKNRIQGEILDKLKEGSTGGTSLSKLKFPHLRTLLTSRWGCYAWVRGSENKFNLNNHILMVSQTFKGRPISDANIQDCVTDIVSKYLPPEYPPWQISLIPCNEEKSFLLIRLHHLYLSEDKLALGDLLLLKDDANSGLINTDSSMDHLVSSGTFRSPLVLFRIYEHACELLANYWNEFVSVYDPLENPLVLKKPPRMSTFIKMLMIVTGSALKEFFTRGGELTSLVAKERKRRHLNLSFLYKCFLNSIEPFNLIISYIRWFWWCVGKLVRAPGIVLRLIMDSHVLFYWLYLINFATQEILYVFKLIYEAPRIILEEIFLPEHPCNVHRLQTLSLCGRKVVCWSNPVPKTLLRQLSVTCHASESELTLAGAASALRDYFDSAGFCPPDCVVTTARFMTIESLLARNAPVYGSLCLPLPTDTTQGDPVRLLKSLQESLKQSRTDQAILYLASLYRLDHNVFTSIFPTLFARASLYLLSRRYSVTLTQIDSFSSNSSLRQQSKRNLLWGPRLDSIMFWRPPQANVCLSLTLITYGDSVQLGVMADALLAPHHAVVASSFSEYFDSLASALNLPKSPESLPSTSHSLPPCDNREVLT